MAGKDLSQTNHTDWFKDTGNKIRTNSGEEITVIEFEHNDDDEKMMLWARHFREHYCLDGEIDALRKGTGLSRAEYLKQNVFPDAKNDFGPATRSGDFGEILVADYLQFVLGYKVPRTRYAYKSIRNESSKGTDVLGFKIQDSSKISRTDVLALYETKAQLSSPSRKNRLQEAIDDSDADNIRKADSLTATRTRLYREGQLQLADIVSRFQNPVDNPYTEIYGAVALFSDNLYKKDVLETTDASSHSHSSQLTLLVIKGEDMMKLTHYLYERAADEA